MTTSKKAIVATVLAIFGFCPCVAQEPSAILEIGAASEYNLKGGGTNFGPNFAVETTPIEHVLEIEGGVSPLFSHGQTEWDTDFLFKKPYTLSDTVEFMAGIGPEWAHTVGGDRTTDTFGAEVALDFMFWPWPGRKYGWYLEPSYGQNFGHGHEQSLSVSVGLLIPIP
jgi:hypothetical protein